MSIGEMYENVMKKKQVILLAPFSSTLGRNFIYRSTKEGRQPARWGIYWKQWRLDINIQGLHKPGEGGWAAVYPGSVAWRRVSISSTAFLINFILFVH